MKIIGFIWLEDIVEKLEVKHNVFPEEVEDVFDNKPRITKMNKGHFRGEDVYRALGQTEAGRYLAIFFIYKLGTGFTKWDQTGLSIAGSNVLNSKDFLPGKGVVNNTEGHRRNLFGRKMRPDEIV